MKRHSAKRIWIAALLAVLAVQSPLMVEEAPSVRFTPLDLYIDSGQTALAAYQVEVHFDPEKVKIVGIEGGETKAYNPAPYYDHRCRLHAGRCPFGPHKGGQTAPPGHR